MFKFSKKQEAVAPQNLEEILSRFNVLQENFAKLSQELENLKKESKFFFKKIGVLRYNPFKEVGGDQSFSIALLDGNDSGVVITSLFSRDGNRVYGKSIKNGKSENILSDEEKEAIIRANNNINNG